jgi:hypothetical protein
VTIEALRLLAHGPASSRPRGLVDAARTVLRTRRRRSREKPYFFGHGRRFIDGKVVKDDRGKKLAALQDIQKAVDVESGGGIELAALWYFFVRKQRPAPGEDLERRPAPTRAVRSRSTRCSGRRSAPDPP